MNFEKPEKSEFWKNEKKLMEVSSFYTYVPKTTIIWGTESGRILFVILGHLLPFYSPPLPPNYPENQNFEKMKKASGDVIILNLSNNKHNHMMYAYSDMECNRQFFVSLGQVLLFYPNTEPENSNFKTM